MTNLKHHVQSPQLLVKQVLLPRRPRPCRRSCRSNQALQMQSELYLTPSVNTGEQYARPSRFADHSWDVFSCSETQSSQEPVLAVANHVPSVQNGPRFLLSCLTKEQWGKGTRTIVYHSRRCQIHIPVFNLLSNTDTQTPHYATLGNRKLMAKVFSNAKCEVKNAEKQRRKKK